jgi:predicted O-methyltransferase YrrM
LSGFENLQLIWGKSQDVLPTLDFESFDLIIVDGSHKTDAVYADAIEARRLIKPGGWIVFDDIRHWSSRARKDYGPARKGLEMFLDEYGDEFDQAWSMGPCECLEKRCT